MKATVNITVEKDTNKNRQIDIVRVPVKQLIVKTFECKVSLGAVVDESDKLATYLLTVDAPVRNRGLFVELLKNTQEIILKYADNSEETLKLHKINDIT